MKPAPSEAKTRGTDPLPEHIRMKWEICCVENDGIVKAKTSGLMSCDDKKKLWEEMLAAGRKNKINAFLVDQKETSFGLSVMEIDRLPDLFRKIGFELKDKMAIVINLDSSNKALFSFLQNVFTLSSLRVSVFTDSEAAAAWLKNKT
jgi:hypothetical protein